MIRSPHSLTAAALVTAALLGGSHTAHAKEKTDLGWSFAEVIGTSLRFVRVDRGCKIVDKDEVAAFMIFECPGDPGKDPKRGALEFYRTEKSDGVRVQVSLADEPGYVEKRFLVLLERKLRDERGNPVMPTKNPPPPQPPAPDAGTN